MEDRLKEITGLVGVKGAFLTDGEGSVVASSGVDWVPPDGLSTIGRVVQQTLSGLALARKRKVGDLDFVYARGRLVAKAAGHGCLFIVTAPAINVALLNMTADVVVKSLREGEPGAAEPGRAAAPAHLREAVRAMAIFLDLLTEEFGNRGLGRQEFLRACEFRASRLSSHYPFLSAVRVTGDKIDISSLPLTEVDPKTIGEGLEHLVAGLCLTARSVLGSGPAVEKYQKVYEPFRQKSERRLLPLGMGERLRDACLGEMPKFGGVEFRLG